MAEQHTFPKLSWSDKEAMELINKSMDAQVRLIEAQVKFYSSQDHGALDAATQQHLLEQQRAQHVANLYAGRQRIWMTGVIGVILVLGGTLWPLVW